MEKLNIPAPPWQFPDYDADYHRALLAYGAYSDRAELSSAMAALKQNKQARFGEFVLPERFPWEFSAGTSTAFVDHNATTGLVAMAFMNERDKQIVIAYRGADNLVDVRDAHRALLVDGDLAAIAGAPFAPKSDTTRAQMAQVQKALYPGDQWHPQFADALDYARQLKDTYEPLGYRFETVGHGLGGSHAQLVAHTFGWGGRAFDPLGAQNLTESRGYHGWLADNGIDTPPGPLPFDRNAPQQDHFRNYTARFSIASELSGPHLGDAQVTSALAGRQGARDHLTYAVATADAVVSGVPLVGDFVAARSGLRAARAGRLGEQVAQDMADSTVRTGADAAARHDMARMVRVFEAAARTGELPTMGQTPATGLRVDRRSAAADMPAAPDPAHADHPMLASIRGHVRALDLGFVQSPGLTRQQLDERFSHNLLALASDAGLARVDHVVLSEKNAANGHPHDGQNVFVIRGRLDDPAQRRAHMPTEAAARVPDCDTGHLLQAADEARVVAQRQAVDTPSMMRL